MHLRALKTLQAALAALAIATVSCLAAAPASAVPAFPGLDAGLTGFSDMVVDQAHGHVFISQGTNRIIVTDLDGNQVDHIDSMWGAAGMTLSADGSRIYATLSTGDAVAAIDTSSLDVTPYQIGVESCPRDIAETLSLLWVVGNCGSFGDVFALDPTTGAVTDVLRNVFDMKLVASPELPGQLFSLDRNVSPASIEAFAVTSGPTPTLTVRTSRWNVGSEGLDLALSPAGDKAIMAARWPNSQHPAFRTSDLGGFGTYASSGEPNSVAVRADGMVAVGSNAPADTDVLVYDPGETNTAGQLVEFGEGRTLAAGALAFGHDRLYAVSTSGGAAFRLHVIGVRKTTRLSLSTDRARYSAGEPATVSVRTDPALAGRTVSFFARPSGGNKVLIASGPLGSAGRFTTEFVVDRNTRFFVEFAGDADFVSARDDGGVGVRALLTTALAGWDHVDHRVRLYSPGAPALIDMAKAPSQAGTCLTVRLERKVAGEWRKFAVRCATLDEAGVTRETLRPRDWLVNRLLRVRSEWPGDSTNIASHSRWRLFEFTS